MSWIITYRTVDGKQNKLTLAKLGKLTPEKARETAERRLAEVVNGRDPAEEKQNNRKAETISELCDYYKEYGMKHKKPMTIRNETGNIERHIKPLLGNIKAFKLTTADIEKALYAIADGKTAMNEDGDKPRARIIVTGGQGAANKTISLLHTILEFGVRHKIIPANPAKGVKKFKDNKSNVFINISEIKALGEALRAPENEKFNRIAVNATKLLLLTGCRKTEVLSLRWEDIDLANQCFRFKDTKTGAQVRPFGIGALNLLKELEQDTDGGWVFPATIGDGHFIGLPKAFANLCKTINKETNKRYFKRDDVTLHSLRHSFASVGADIGFKELSLAGLLGHRLGGITNRYSHNVDSSLINTANKVSLYIEAALNGINKTTTAKIVNIGRGA